MKPVAISHEHVARALSLSSGEKFVRAAHLAGCPRDQLENLLRIGCILQPVQLQASAAARRADRDDQPDEIGYGGARGGGKSHWMLAQLVEDCLRYPGLKCLMLRKVGKALKEAFKDLLPKVMGGIQGEYEYIPSRSVLEFTNGSLIIIGHFQKESDIDAYLGLEYDVIGVEEATTLTFSKYRAIKTCCRTSKPGWRPRMYSTTNPGNIGHAWYKERFITAPGAWRTFVHATVDDNAFINKEYTRNLEELTGWQLQAWRYGSWDIAAGQFFTNFRRDVHVVPALPAIPRHWKVWGSLDYGFTHYTVAYLLAQDGDGNVYITAEHGERQWLPEQHAGAIKDLFGSKGVPMGRLAKFVAGGDVFNPESDGLDIAHEYKQHGITLVRADMNRINGAAELLKRLGNPEILDKDGRSKYPPRLRIFDSCPQLIDCITQMQHDPRRPEDVLKTDCDEDGFGGDDWYDAARYGLMDAKIKRRGAPAVAEDRQQWTAR